MSKRSTSESGGRWGREPFKPDDLVEKFGTGENDSRLEVTCPGCGNQWYPTTQCCVSRYAGDPFCPECGTDFRTESITFQPKVKFWDVEALTHRKGTGLDVTDDIKRVLDILDEADSPEAAKARDILRETFGTLEPVERKRTEE